MITSDTAPRMFRIRSIRQHVTLRTSRPSSPPNLKNKIKTKFFDLIGLTGFSRSDDQGSSAPRGLRGVVVAACLSLLGFCCLVPCAGLR